MLDIMKAYTYTDGSGYVWKYFGDDTDSDQYYLVPKIWFTEKNGRADFQLVEYQADRGGSSDGYCYMQLEMAASGEIEKNIKKAIVEKKGAQPVIQVLSDQRGSTLLTCLIRDNGRLQYITEIPLFKAWTNSIVLFKHLSSAEIALFKNALAKGGEGIFFHYPLTVESRLPATDCTIRFNIGRIVKKMIETGTMENLLETSLQLSGGFRQIYDMISHSLEETVHCLTSDIQSDTVSLINNWGKQRIQHHLYSHLREVHLNAKQTERVYFNQSGENDILPLIKSTGNSSSFLKSSSPTDYGEVFSSTPKDFFAGGEKKIMEAYKQTEQWVSKVLEKQIDNGLYQYRGVLQELFLGIESIRSFCTDFKESQLIPWIVDLETKVGYEDLSEDWDTIYTISRTKNFTLNVMTDIGFENTESIEVIVRYPGLSPAASRCLLTDENRSCFFSCPQVLSEGNEYQFSFLVNYHGSVPPLLVIHPSGATAPSVIIQNKDIGLLQVKFYANYIDYQSEVNFIKIHFFFKDITSTEEPFIQEFTLNESSPEITVQSLRSRPINNKYEYMVTYHLKNETVYEMETEDSNGENVYLFGPPRPVELGILLNGRNMAAVDKVSLNVFYFDAQNKKISRNVQLTPSAYYTSIEVYSRNGSHLPIYYSGTIQYNNGKTDQTIDQTVITSSMIVIDPDYRFFSVKLDASAVQWENQLTLMQANLTPRNPVNKTSITEGFQFSPRAKTYAFWGFYIPVSSVPQYIWNSAYFFAGWVSLRTPEIPEKKSPLTLPDTPSADEMCTLITKAFGRSDPLSPQDMIKALLVSPYLPCDIAPVIHKNYPQEKLGSLLHSALGFQNCSNAYLGIMTFALRQTGVSQEQTLSEIKTVFPDHWSSAYESTVNRIYQSQSIKEIKNLIDKRTPASRAGTQIKPQFPLSAEEMTEELVAAYYLVNGNASYGTLSAALRNAGYSLSETSEASKSCYKPEWSIGLYNIILDNFCRNQTVSLSQAASGYCAAGFSALESAPQLYDRFSASDALAMGTALMDAWPSINTLQLQESLKACLTDAGEEAYSRSEIDRAMPEIFSSRNCGISLSGQSSAYLKPNEFLASGNNQYRLVYELDGNLVLYKTPDTILWQTNTGGKPAWRTYMQSDGNFVVYQGVQQPVWASNTEGNSQCTITVQDDGNLVLMNRLSKSIWATNTQQTAPIGSGSNLGDSLLGRNNPFLAPNDYMLSENAAYSLIYHTTGNLALYDKSRTACWQTNTTGKPAWRTYMQPDGNFVVYQGSHQPVWASNTDYNWTYSRLELTNEGTLQIFGNSKRIIWQKN